MPRKPDLPCASCGKMLWRRSGISLPLGQATCHPCRRLRAIGREQEVKEQRRKLLPEAACEMCGVSYRQASPTYKTCGAACRGEFLRIKRAKFYRVYGSTGNRKRARKYGVAYETIHYEKVFDRDEWLCGICGESVSKHLEYPHPLSASLDHVVPISRGGPHLYSNVQCAHLKCNVSKRASYPADSEVSRGIDGGSAAEALRAP